jgi:hypothetical protein
LQITDQGIENYGQAKSSFNGVRTNNNFRSFASNVDIKENNVMKNLYFIFALLTLPIVALVDDGDATKQRRIA